MTNHPEETLDNEPGAMTLEELRRIVSVLANSTWTRYWVDWRGHPSSDRAALLALCAINEDGTPAKLDEHALKREGFVKEADGGLEFWVVRRVDEEGNAWRNRAL